jgi:hypothetical protein
VTKSQREETLDGRRRAARGSHRALLIALALGAATFLQVSCRQQQGSPPAGPSQTGVQFVSIHGRVRVQKAGTFEWLEATPDVTLGKDDKISTDDHATAQIRYPDGTTFDVRPGSVIVIIEISRPDTSGQPGVGLGLQRGGTDFMTDRKEGYRHIEAPGGRTLPSPNAAGSVQVAPDGQTAFRYFDGRGLVEPRSGPKLELGPREGVEIDPQGRAGRKMPLPELPAPTAPSDESRILVADPSRATTRLAWSAVTGAQSYHVVVDTTAAFASPVRDRRVDGGTTLELQDLEAGRYCWRVAAIDTNGTEGGFSPARCFALVARQTNLLMAPPLALDVVELRANQLLLKGRTDPGAVMTVNGERVPLQPDGSFDEHLALRATTTALSIRVVGPGGAVTEQQLPIVAAR